MTLSTFLSTPSIRLFCVESFSSTACRMTEVCSVSSFSTCGMIDNCPFGCAVVDFDMNGGVMACTFKYRYLVEAVNGRLAAELLISDSKEELETRGNNP